MRIRRWIATVVVAAVIGAGLSLAPLAPAPSAQAASKLEGWVSAMSKTFGVAGKVFGIEKSIGFLAGTGVLSFAGPLLSILLTDSGPSIGDVLKKLSTMENQLTSMKQELDAIDAEVRRTDVDVLMGTCSVETSSLTSLLTEVETAQSEYGQIIDQMKNIDDVGDVENLKRQTDGFIQSVFGTGKTSQTFVDGTDMGMALSTAHNKLVSTGGSRGIIESCGKAYLQEWRNQNASPSAIASMSSTAPGAWVGDQGYYEPVQDLVVFWQTVQAQGVFLLQQAAYLQAIEGYATEVGPLSIDDSAQACASVKKGSKAFALCASTLKFTKKFYDNTVSQWQQAGVPYSNDDVVLSLGSDITGLKGAGNTTIPTTVWARDPDRFGNGTNLAKGTPALTTFPGDTSYGGLTGWAPADSKQWSGLSAGLVASHPSTSVKPATVLQPFTMSYVGDQYKALGVAPFNPADVLGAMGATVRSEGGAQFAQTGALYWIPGETATRALTDHTTAKGLIFPQASKLPDMPDVWGKKFLPFYGGPGLSINCMVAPVDGVLCDGATVGSWWVARQKSSYSVESSNYFTKNYTGAATWSVTPSSADVPGFSVNARNVSCSGGNYCGIPMNGAVTSMPPWLASFTDSVGVVHDPAVDVAGYTQRVWPSLKVPTGSGCTTVWGVPTRCGDAMKSWIASKIQDPTVSMPAATSAPSLAVGATTDAALCGAPTWSTRNGSDAGSVRYSDVTWTAVDAAGQSVSVAKAWGEPLSLAADIDPLLTQSPRPTGLSIACSVTAGFEGYPATLQLTSNALPAALVAGAWQVGVLPGATVTDQPDSVTADAGSSAMLSATVATKVAATGAGAGDAGASTTTPPASTDSPIPSPSASPSPSGDAPSAGAPSAADRSSSPPSLVLASAIRPAVAGSNLVLWEKREAGTDDWTPVDLPSEESDSGEAVGPLALEQRVLTSELPLTDLDGDDLGDSYRAVYTDPSGVTITTSEATISLTTLDRSWLWIVLGSLVLLLGGGAVTALVRRRRQETTASSAS